MDFLQLSSQFLESRGAIHTAREISQQPDMWEKTYLRIVNRKKSLIDFINKVWGVEELQVILSGAGTSAFIGETLAASFQRKWDVCCKSVETTDIITHPENCFIKTKPTLLISFARSGNSPESMQACILARKYCSELYELNITCNANGALAKQPKSGTVYTLLLPEETDDVSLAMTSSYTSMLLAGFCVSFIWDIEVLKPVVSILCNLGNHILTNYLDGIKAMAEKDFDRMVFLGSGPLKGVAHEATIKVQEMSNGKVVCKFDSFMGFRHGPKAVVNDSTVIMYLLSNKAYPNLYELDLIRSVKETAAGEKTIVIGNNYHDQELKFDLEIRFPDTINDVPEEFLSVFYILPAQLFAFYKSLSLCLSPDSPSVNGAISRVVQGVTIYPIIE